MQAVTLSNVTAHLSYSKMFFLLTLNPHNAEIFVYKPWKPKCFFQFEIIMNVPG